MRTAKKTLGDGKEYTLTTLNRLEIGAYRDTIKANKKAQTEFDTLNKKLMGDEGLTERELIRYDELEQKLEEEGFTLIDRVIRQCLSKRHKEFAFQNDAQRDKEIDQKLAGIIDIRDSTQIVEFATTGTVTRQKEESFKEQELVL